MSIRVLIADDHTILREGLKLILESRGDIKVVAEATDGLDAVKKAKEFNPDVIVMDVSMPNMNGIEATGRILEENKKVKIVILSMKASSEDIYRALHAGATGYLLKESAGSEIADAVHAAVNNRRYLSRKVDDILIDSYIFERKNLTSRSPLESLSSREREILQLVAEGKTSNEIASMLYLSVKTVETYRSRLMQKLVLKDSSALIKFAIEQGLAGN
ncbi:MAG TPA: response regulator transcription factor [Ignavibacteriaceae bacterium]|jgi:DNA-binding NarL/FixJ family response regulator|nr:response regulator transcription factor [Ignavibacteriaceae bacterium]HOJ18863.1 response regulator transcription factor [Ignavibacteriaceae bacterium]